MFGLSSTNQLIIIVALLFTAIAITLIFVAMKDALEDSRKIKARLKGNWKEESTGTILKKNEAFQNFANHLSMPDETEISKIRARLSKAGYYGKSAVKTYYAIRILCLVIPQLIFMLNWAIFMPQLEQNLAISISCGLIVTGLMGPPLFIRYKMSRRTRQVRNGFPDMMDLMVACIEAGLGMNAALLRVAEEIGNRYPVLKINLDLLNMELRAGRERHVGMLNFAKRVNMEETHDARRRKSHGASS